VNGWLEFEPAIDINTKVAFLRYVDDHLKQTALTIERTRHYVCEKCGGGADPSSVQWRIAAGKTDIICSACEDWRIIFQDGIEKRFESREIKEEVRQLDQQSQAAKLNENREMILLGEVFAVVGRAGQIFRPTPNSKDGMDGE